jgi:hypothetical protein
LGSKGVGLGDEGVRERGVVVGVGQGNDVFLVVGYDADLDDCTVGLGE